MMTEAEFQSLLNRMEDETLDFKATSYPFDETHGRLSLVRDVVCMANTPRESPSFIVLGVNKHPDGNYDLLGIESHPDEAMLQSQFSDRVYPVPDFAYEPVVFHAQSFGIISILPSRTGPCVPLRDYNGVLRQWQIYFRRGSRNDVARPDDVANILSWFDKGVASRAPYRAEDPAWEQLARQLYAFDPAYHFLLIISPLRSLATPDVSALGKLPWASVLDFDPNSDARGVLAAAKREIERRRSLHIVTLQDRVAFNPHGTTYWLFTRGLMGREASGEVGAWPVWIRQYGGSLSEHLRRLAAAFSPTPTKCIALWYEPSLLRHLRSTLEQALTAFAGTASLVIVGEDPAELQPIAAEFDASLITMPFHHVCAGLASIVPTERPRRFQSSPTSLPGMRTMLDR